MSFLLRLHALLLSWCTQPEGQCVEPVSPHCHHAGRKVQVSIGASVGPASIRASVYVHWGLCLSSVRQGVCLCPLGSLSVQRPSGRLSVSIGVSVSPVFIRASVCVRQGLCQSGVHQGFCLCPSGPLYPSWLLLAFTCARSMPFSMSQSRCTRPPCTTSCAGPK